MDLVISTNHFPTQGQTVLGEFFETIPGGKGANQAVAAARLGAPTAMIGCVGNDSFGTTLYSNLENENVDVKGIATSKKATGIANILLYEKDNRIIVVPGANYDVDEALIDQQWSVISQSKLVVLQLEIPVPTVDYILMKCKESGVPVLLNPAPAKYFDVKWLKDVTYLTPNENECEEIFGKLFTEVVKDYPNKVIVTLGGNGAYFYDGEQPVHVKGYSAKVIDTTGAGDTFNGALSYAICEGYKLQEAVQFANSAASISVEKFGAQGGMPSNTEVMARLGQLKNN